MAYSAPGTHRGLALAEAGAILETVNAEGEAPGTLLKPSVRSQLGLQTDAEEEEDHTDWLAANFPVPEPAPKVPKLDS